VTIPDQFAVRDQRRSGWFSIDNEIIDDYGRSLGAYGIAVYTVLCRRVKPSSQRVDGLSQRDIAAIIGISQDRVRKSLSDLAQLRLIHIEAPDHPSPGVFSVITLLAVGMKAGFNSGIETERHTFSSCPQPNATRSPNKEEKNKTKTKKLLPPTPLKEGGDLGQIWQRICECLKDDLSDAYVKNPLFQESAYDKYFRDAWLVEIKGGIAVLNSTSPNTLREGVEKFQKRLRETFRAVVFEISVVRVTTSIQEREATA